MWNYSQERSHPRCVHMPLLRRCPPQIVLMLICGFTPYACVMSDIETHVLPNSSTQQQSASPSRVLALKLCSCIPTNTSACIRLSTDSTACSHIDSHIDLHCCVYAGAGTVTSVTQLDCSTYTVQGYMPQNDPFEVNSTTVVLQLMAGVASACNGTFPAASQLAAVNHR